MEQFQADHGFDPAQQGESTEAENITASKTADIQVAQEPVVNATEDRIKELIKVDKGLPHSLMLEFITPKDGSIYNAVREAVQRNDFSDQSHLLFDSHHRQTAKVEYDSNSQKQMDLTLGQWSKHNAPISNEKNGCKEMQKREAAQAALENRHREEKERLEAETQQQMRDDELLKDALIQALEEPEAARSTDNVSQESGAALIQSDQLDLPSAVMANEDEPLFPDLDIPDTFGQFSDLFGEDKVNQQQGDFDHQARDNLFADEFTDEAWSGPLF